MPDAWEKAAKLDHTRSNAAGRNLSTGYDNIEVYINSLVKENYFQFTLSLSYREVLYSKGRKYD